MTERRHIGRFELRDEVASGASGTIYQARDLGTGERVALKLIRGLGHVDAARFAREARILAEVRHPGVVRYVEHGHTAEGDAYIAMEWLEGEDLRDRLARAGLSMNEVVALGRRVAGALAAIHARGLVHRDVKPGNLFLPGGRADEATIIDFGLARADEGATALTQTGLVVGTPAYMAPEQARGQREVDGRADLFSLGCVLFKCLAGHAPFEGTSIMAVLTKVLLEEPPRLRTLRPEVPATLEALCAAMLQKDPERRPASAAAVEEALAAVGPLGAAGEAAEPAPPSRAFSGLTGGEQRVMAMVFVGAYGEDAPVSGVRGSEVSQTEQAVAALVREHGAKLDRLVDGTGVVTLSGPGMATDQAARAARLSLALHGLLPGVPMALATGRGDVARRVPVGDTIERAARLLGRRADALRVAREAPSNGEPEPSAIAVDDVTAALLGARFDLSSSDGGTCLEGLRELEMGAHTLLGRYLPMVGRDWELSSIETLFFDCVEEPLARPVLVTAAAGMGKSRLGHEVVRALRRRIPDLEVWTGRGDPRRAGSELGLLDELLRGAPPARDPGRTLPDPLAAAEARFAAACLGHPLLVVIDDFHWADAATVRFLEATLGSLERRPWMVLALGRPEVHARFPRLWGGRHLQEIPLNPLSRRAGERLVRQALGDAASAETMTHLVARAEGNAFYLEELIRAVAEATRAGATAGTSGTGATSGASGRGAERLPETVLAMAQARLEGLDAEARRVLRAASVFGELFWPGGVAALLGEEPSRGWDDRLVARELLVRRPSSRFAGEKELGFRNGLLRDAAYATLTEADRALGHRLAAEWLLAQGERDVSVLAQHQGLAAAWEG
jgi:hypothetical protein